VSGTRCRFRSRLAFPGREFVLGPSGQRGAVSSRGCTNDPIVQIDGWDAIRMVRGGTGTPRILRGWQPDRTDLGKPGVQTLDMELGGMQD
jgi:hypothetical protein